MLLCNCCSRQPRSRRIRGTAARGRDEVGEARCLVATAAADEDVRVRLLASRSTLEAIVETADAPTALRRGEDTHDTSWYSSSWYLTVSKLDLQLSPRNAPWHLTLCS